MILWFMDRMGLPGHYHATWVRLLRDNYILTNEVLAVSLHKQLAPKQLLTRLGSRKAPTWLPEMQFEITRTIDAIIALKKPRAVVLSSPESLACLGLAPEHATLHALRGSVYWRNGVPHIVMLPMSAWFSMVNQKEIGAANYGFESADAFNAYKGQQGSLQAESSKRIAVEPEGRDQLNPQTSLTATGGDELPRTGRSGVVGGTRSESPSELDDGEGEDDSLGSDSDSDPDGDMGVAGDTDSVEPDDEDTDHDQFFYEPVLSPVGRFVLTADVQKLFRILRDGKNAGGPSIPIEVRY